MSAGDYSTSSSGTDTPPQSLTNSWSMPATVSHAVSGLLRHFSSEAEPKHSRNIPPSFWDERNNGLNEVYTPPYRTASPFQPPPLYPVVLTGHSPSTPASARLLSKGLAEEIRLLVPPRLQLYETWRLVYSLEEDGVSLGTLYKKCEELRGLRNGFVLVVKDGEGSLFGAYLTDAPHVAPHYFGTGECFLWRASVLSGSFHASLPPPPSADTTNAVRSTTISASSVSPRLLSPSHPPRTNLSSLSSNTSSTSLVPPSTNSLSFQSGISTPERIRFKAFPYSGVNDYLMLCEAGFLSLGGGDGHYGLWLNDNFEKGVSSRCLTFGNEPLSEEGEKFDILGVELWTLGTT